MDSQPAVETGGKILLVVQRTRRDLGRSPLSSSWIDSEERVSRQGQATVLIPEVAEVHLGMGVSISVLA